MAEITGSPLLLLPVYKNYREKTTGSLQAQITTKSRLKTTESHSDAHFPKKTEYMRTLEGWQEDSRSLRLAWSET